MKYSTEVEGLEFVDRQAETSERQVHVSLWKSVVIQSQRKEV